MYAYLLRYTLALALRLHLLPRLYRMPAGRIVDWLKAGELQQARHALRRSMTIETVSICNAKCSFCSYPILEFPKQPISPDDFERALSLAQTMRITDLDFTPYLGEAFVDPKFLDRVAAARARLPGTRIRLTTNGTFLTRIDIPRFLASGFDQVNVSFGAWGPKDYIKLYNIDAWDRVYQGVCKLLETKRETRSSTKISLWFRVLDEKAIKSNPEYLAFCERYKDVINSHIVVSVYHDIQAISGQQPKEIKLERHFDGGKLKSLPCVNMGNVGVSSSGNTFACYCVATDAFKQASSEFYLGKLSGMDPDQMKAAVEKMVASWRQKGPPSFCRTCPVYVPASDTTAKDGAVEQDSSSAVTSEF